MEGEHQRTSEDAKFENSEQPAVPVSKKQEVLTFFQSHCRLPTVFESDCFLTPKQKRMMSKLCGKLVL